MYISYDTLKIGIIDNNATSSRVCRFGLRGERYSEMQLQPHGEVLNYSGFYDMALEKYH